jgi:hypothetical protein
LPKALHILDNVLCALYNTNAFHERIKG